MELNGISLLCHWCLELSLEFSFRTLSHVLVVNLEVGNLNQTLNDQQPKLIQLIKSLILRK